MLNGVGGRTIADAKANISYAEVLAWVAYRDKHGSLNFIQRQEHVSAMVALQVNRLRGGEADLLDFMPHGERPPLTLERAMEEWV